MPPPTLSYDASWGDEAFDSTMIIGKKASLEALTPKILESLGLVVPDAILQSMMAALDDKAGGGPSTTLLLSSGGDVHKFQIASLPSQVSRHNHPMAVHSLTSLASKAVNGDHSRLIILTDDFAVAPLGLAVAKAFSLFSLKTGGANANTSTTTEKHLHVCFCQSDGSLVTDADALKAAQVAAKGAQLTARLVDSYPELLTTTQFVQEISDLIVDVPQITMTEIVGDELAEQGYGGLYAVGKAAIHPPRLVILEYDGGNDETVALVGKGIVFDTGGLSLKPKVDMCGMKMDMGGAAGLLGGFLSAAELGVSKKVVLILCLAENAIGPNATRNDDILRMYSGKTVEINNADAEGRVVLGDGVAHASKHIENLDLIVDMATLTGAQLVCTGKKHAAILCNKPELETRFFDAGRHSGDLCYPILYMPENLMNEFKSEVADMKNSVKDRSNAQTSCAGHFIEAHLHESYQGGWVHVDMAGPAFIGDRGTGYGVGLVLSVLGAPGF